MSHSIKFTSTANTQFATISGILTLATPIAVVAGEVVEVQITALVGMCMINLYFTQGGTSSWDSKKKIG